MATDEKKVNLLEYISQIISKEDNKINYSISINGISTFINFHKNNIKLGEVAEKYSTLLDSTLVQEKTAFDNDGKIYSIVAHFSIKTDINDKNILEFLMKLIDYKANSFNSRLCKAYLAKYKDEKLSFVIHDVKSINHKVYNLDLFNSESKNFALLGEYYFTNYWDFQKEMTRLAHIWIDYNY